MKEVKEMRLHSAFMSFKEKGLMSIK